MKLKFLVGIICIVIVATGSIVAYSMATRPSPQKTILAFCGAASKPVMEEAAQTFEKETGIKVELTLGGSGTMLSQMKISKIGDLYIPGSDDYMLRAIKDGIVDSKTVKVLAYLIPAIIVQEGNPKNIKSLEDLAKPGITVGIADPESVCVGEYAVNILKYNNLWDDVEKNIVVHAESCDKTAVLIYLKQVDVVIGWRDFANWDPEKADAVLINPEKIPKIASIPGGISTYSENKVEAEKFLNFLASQSGQEIFRKYGYITALDEAKTYAPNAEEPAF